MNSEQTFNPDWFSKPGDSLRSLMMRRGISTFDLSRYFKDGMNTLRGILDGSEALDSDRAAVLVKAVGGTADFWMKRQLSYDLALERAVSNAATEEVDEWLKLPVPGTRPSGRLSELRKREEVRRRLAFFNVSNIKAWEARYGKLCSATLFRMSPAFQSDAGATLMWLRSGELGADLVSTRPWSPGALQDRLEAIRKLSKVKSPDLFLPKLTTLCAEAGVAVVTRKAPQGCRASGASRMVAPDKAMVLLSFRGLTDDKFWFTVFHEIGHLLLHGACTFLDSDMEGIDKSEQEANEFATDCIIPKSRFTEFKCLAKSKEDIMRFGVSVGVSAGLIVGQLQHQNMIGIDELNYLKRRWTWTQLDKFIN